ncbi:MAG: hypothetical protein IJ893_03300 [Bacteroidales bacterium]|nr:hypothetical protein [Bacteroidales bacterium]MBR2226879.1 hypothetical protein [Bacteroidales bacterium]MBR4688702.1 hypothetical protein [Bacteroidales bacterium]
MKKCLVLIALAAVSACQMVHRVSDSAAELFGDAVVARVGEHRLMRSELAAYIPAGVSSEDSLALAQSYIKSWAEELIFLDMAEKHLSDEEKDVTKDLEDYRRTLLKYRYEERYINDRLDTLISDEEVRNYYREHMDKFLVERPLLKARYMIIPADSRSLKTIKELMSSDDAMDAIAADSLAFTAALRYVDSSDAWMDAILLARDLGTDEASMMKALRNRTIEFKGDDGLLRVAYVVDMVQKGSPAPLDYCEERIKDILLSARKHELVGGLERDLLNDALAKGKFVIY